MQVGDRYRHLKRGTSYTVLATGLLQIATRQVVEGDRVVAYRGVDGDVWFRAEAEFLDGRFEAIDGSGFEAQAPWGWYHSADEEQMSAGPFASREEAIADGKGYGYASFPSEGENPVDLVSFHIQEAANDPLRLADWIGADRLIERADEEVSESDRVSSDWDDGAFFECTAGQEEDLQERIRRACDEWQAAHGLIFTCHTFSRWRNGEVVTVPVVKAA